MFNAAPQSRLSQTPDRQLQPAVIPANSTDNTANWSIPVRTLLDQPPSVLPFRLAVGGVAFLACFATWAWFGQLNEVAYGQGKLIPKGNVYKVNPLETGKVARVLVKEGDVIKAGQVLVELDTELATREIERLEKELMAAHTELNQTSNLLMQSQLQDRMHVAVIQTTTQAQEVEVAQAQGNISTTRQLLEQLQVDALAQEERLSRLQPLVAAGAISQEQIFQIEQQLRSHQRTITEHEGTLQRLITEAQRSQVGLKQKQTEEQEFLQEAKQRSQQQDIKLAQLQAKISQLQTLIKAANSKLKQQFLYAPADGMISTLNIHNPGEVVQIGQPIAEIAPSGKPLVVSALLPSQEAGFVKAGMPVQVKLDAYPYQDYGIIAGKVMTVSPDAQANEKLGQAYRVEVELDRTYVTKEHQKVLFKSGQTATTEIVTRRRRILDLLTEPFKKLQGDVNL